MNKIQKLNPSMENALKALYQNRKTGLRQYEISEAIGLTYPGTKRTLEVLEEKRLISIHKKGGAVTAYIDRNGEYYVLKKIKEFDKKCQI